MSRAHRPPLHARRQPGPASPVERLPIQKAAARHRKRDAVILTAARAFQERGFHQHVARRRGRAARRDQADDLSLRRQQGADPVRVLPHRSRPDSRAFSEVPQSGRAGAASDSSWSYADMRPPSRPNSAGAWSAPRTSDLSPAMSSQIKTLKSEIDQGIRRLLREGREDGSIRDVRSRK